MQKRLGIDTVNQHDSDFFSDEDNPNSDCFDRNEIGARNSMISVDDLFEKCSMTPSQKKASREVNPMFVAQPKLRPDDIPRPQPFGTRSPPKINPASSARSPFLFFRTSNATPQHGSWASTLGVQARYQQQLKEQTYSREAQELQWKRWKAFTTRPVPPIRMQGVKPKAIDSESDEDPWDRPTSLPPPRGFPVRTKNVGIEAELDALGL
jgi:hypothetical protein